MMNTGDRNDDADWQIHWQASVWHALCCALPSGTSLDDRLGRAAMQSVLSLVDEYADYRRPSRVMLIRILRRLTIWPHWSQQVVPSQPLLASLLETIVDPLPHRSRCISKLSERLAVVFQRIVGTVPGIVCEAPLYAELLRQRWLNSGSPVLHRIKSRLQRSSGGSPYRVIPVYPVNGGGGWLAPACRSVVIEAIPVTSMWAPSEALRLCWLISQVVLTAECDRDSDWEGAARISGYAMIPMVLAAAAECGLQKPPNQEDVLATMMAWCPELQGGPAEAAEHVWRWWQEQTDQGFWAPLDFRLPDERGKF